MTPQWHAALISSYELTWLAIKLKQIAVSCNFKGFKQEKKKRESECECNKLLCFFYGTITCTRPI